MQKEERIKTLVEKIRKSAKQEKPRKSQPGPSRVPTKQQPNKPRKMFIGWLHRSSSQSRFKQVRMKDGGGIRDFTYTNDDEITVDFLKEKASKLFFPEGDSKLGALPRMKLELGNYAQQKITAFKNTEGEVCTFQEYLRSRGLFASRCYIYLMSTSTEEEDGISASVSQRQEACSQLKLSGQAESVQSGVSDVFMGLGLNRAQLSGELGKPTGSSSSRNAGGDKEKQRPLYVLKDVANSVPTQQVISQNGLIVTYEYCTESSFSDVMMKSLSFSIASCYELRCLNEPQTLDEELEAFDPLENGFTIADICKGKEYFVEKCYFSKSEDVEDFRYVFPRTSDTQSSSTILHPPSEVWGDDGNQLIIGVIASCHLGTNTWYIWYRDGKKVKEGNNCCCLIITSPGSYLVEVHCGEEKATSKPVVICPVDELEPPSIPVAGMEAKESHCLMSEEVHPPVSGKDGHGLLPVVEKDEVILKDEIGRGSFGTVYKGLWAGTDVAVKHIKVRNAKRLQAGVESEIKMHSLVRHPNIVQIMAISFLKNAIYLVSELIKGPNLDDLLFSSDDKNDTHFTIQRCNKLHLAKQICQAVAYLHNLKPPVVHRDIKPANVFVDEATQVTKLCDMGLSKLKSAQSVSHTTSTGIPGTPSYMAPECLLERKKATVNSDVWSLAVTLIELFTETDCWGEQLQDNGAQRESHEEDESAVDSLLALMKKKDSPRSLGLLSTTVGNSFQGILEDCFQYDISKRPRAIALVSKFP